MTPVPIANPVTPIIWFRLLSVELSFSGIFQVLRALSWDIEAKVAVSLLIRDCSANEVEAISIDFASADVANKPPTVIVVKNVTKETKFFMILEVLTSCTNLILIKIVK